MTDNITSIQLQNNDNNKEIAVQDQNQTSTPQIISSAAVQKALELANTSKSNGAANYEWQTKRSRRTRDNSIIPKTKTLGTSHASNVFIGVEKRVWIYLYRVQRGVMPVQIQEFIKKKPGFETLDVHVSELPTEETKNKCFLVTAPFSQKDEMYKPNFWPKDVGIKRYDFRLQSKYNAQKKQHF